MKKKLYPDGCYPYAIEPKKVSEKKGIPTNRRIEDADFPAPFDGHQNKCYR